MENLEPTFLVSTEYPLKYKICSFSQLYNIRFDIKSLILLWDFNSYLINIHDKYFIINGGRKIQPNVFNEMKDFHLIYARRNRINIVLDSDKPTEKPQKFYLFGIEGKFLDNMANSILLQISEDGTQWIWRDKK